MLTVLLEELMMMETASQNCFTTLSSKKSCSARFLPASPILMRKASSFKSKPIFSANCCGFFSQ